MRLASGSGPRLTAVVADGTGELALVFLGRASIEGMAPGAVVEAEGMVGRVENELAMRNPRYRFVVPPSEEPGGAPAP